MADLPNVNPGDLIRADFINGLVAAITDLRTRLSNLEASQSRVLISGITDTAGLSSGGYMAIGDQIIITGLNFTVPPSSNTISFGGVSVPAVAGNSYGATLIACNIPTVTLGAGSTAVNVPVVVGNANGTSAAWTISVGPTALQSAATVTVGYAGVLGTTTSFSANTPVSLSFQAKITATLVAPTTFTASVPATTGGWAATILGSTTTTLQPAAQIGQPTSTTWALTVQVTPPPNTTGTNLATIPMVVTVNSTVSGPVTNPSLNLTFGQSAPNVDNRVTLAIVPAATFPLIASAASTSFSMALRAGITTAGTFTMSFPNPPTGWIAPPSSPVSISNPTIPTKWSLPAGWTSTSSADLSVEIKSTDASPSFDQTWTFPVVGGP